MAATHTPNLNLNKPDRQDFVSVVHDINDNMDKIDEEAGMVDDGIAIVIDGNTAPRAISSGQYLLIKNHSTLATGGYHATANIANGESVTSSNVAVDSDGIANALNSNLTATNDRTLTKRYYQAVTINTTNTTWSWSTGYIQLVGDLILYSSGISPKTATNDWLRVATVESSYKPTYEVKTVCVAEDGTSSRVIRIDTNGNIEIYKPEVKTYWFTLVWLRNISN